MITLIFGFVRDALRVSNESDLVQMVVFYSGWALPFIGALLVPHGFVVYVFGESSSFDFLDVSSAGLDQSRCDVFGFQPKGDKFTRLRPAGKSFCISQGKHPDVTVNQELSAFWNPLVPAFASLQRPVSTLRSCGSGKCPTENSRVRVRFFTERSNSCPTGLSLVPKNSPNPHSIRTSKPFVRYVYPFRDSVVPGCRHEYWEDHGGIRVRTLTLAVEATSDAQ